MPDLRSEGSGNAKVQEPPKLAVRVGEAISITMDYTNDLGVLPVGEYDILGEETKVLVDSHTRVRFQTRLRLRRTL